MFTALLLVIFLIHLVAFVILGLRRRQLYYLALVVTFSLLSAAAAVRLLAPDLAVTRELALEEALRMAALAAASVSIGWTLVRLGSRVAARRLPR